MVAIRSGCQTTKPSTDWAYPTYLVEGGQHFVRHMVLEHSRRDEHLVECGVLRPDGLIDGFVFVQDLPANDATCRHVGGGVQKDNNQSRFKETYQ